MTGRSLRLSTASSRVDIRDILICSRRSDWGRPKMIVRKLKQKLLHGQQQSKESNRRELELVAELLFRKGVLACN